MRKTWYGEMTCDDCHTHMGYYIDCGPRGSWICDDCYSNEPDTEGGADDEE